MVKTLHLLGRDAGNFPGLVLWTINKDCLKAFKVDCPIVAVTGTNGQDLCYKLSQPYFCKRWKEDNNKPGGK